MDKDEKSMNLGQQLADSIKQAGVVVSLYETNADDNNVSLQRKQEKQPEERIYTLSDKKDNNDYLFYESQGSIDLWDITPLTTMARRQNAPVRITERGLEHIISEHSQELKSASKKDIFQFLDRVFANATTLRISSSPSLFVVVSQDRTDKVAVVKLNPSSYGDFYNVETAGYYRKNKWRDYEKVIAELREPTQSAAVSDDSKPRNSLQNGRKPIDTKSQSTSECKDNNNSRNMQEKSNKNDVKPLILDETGELKAFSYKGAIYINKKYLTPEVTLHEYTHLWAEVLRQCNPKEWQNIVAMMKETPEIWNYVQKTYPDLRTEDNIAEEVLAQYSGKRGQEKLLAFVEGKDTSDNIIQKISEALSYFWDAVCDFLHIHYTDKEQVADRVLYDLLTGVNPLTYAGKNKLSDTAMEEKKLDDHVHLYDELSKKLAVIMPKHGDGVYLAMPLRMAEDSEKPIAIERVYHDLGKKPGEFVCANMFYHMNMSDMSSDDLRNLIKVFDKKLHTNSNVTETKLNKTTAAAKEAIHDRIVTPTARWFMNDQAKALKNYSEMFPAEADTKELFSQLFDKVSQEPDVSRCPEKWKSDALEELLDLAEGITRNPSKSIHV